MSTRWARPESGEGRRERGRAALPAWAVADADPSGAGRLEFAKR